MSRNILPPARPKRNRALIDAVASHFSLDPAKLNIVFVRGHYLDSMGKPGKDDINVYDDACFIFAPNLFESYNANTNPSFVKRGTRRLAQLNLGRYQFYQGLHKGRYKALRAYPEGVVLDCTREGKPSTCRYINIHKGSTNPKATDIVWSEGCLTLPDTQFGDFILRVYNAMDRLKQKTVEVVLVENGQTSGGQRLFDHFGKQIN